MYKREMVYFLFLVLYPYKDKREKERMQRREKGRWRRE
jgi:hypothetical protein